MTNKKKIAIAAAIVAVVIVIIIVIVILTSKKGVTDINGVYHKYGEWYTQNTMNCAALSNKNPGAKCIVGSDDFTLVLDRDASLVPGRFVTEDDGKSIIYPKGTYDVGSGVHSILIYRTNKYEIQRFGPIDSTIRSVGASKMRYMPLGSAPK
jgi:hypothetical protein